MKLLGYYPWYHPFADRQIGKESQTKWLLGFYFPQIIALCQTTVPAILSRTYITSFVNKPKINIDSRTLGELAWDDWRTFLQLLIVTSTETTVFNSRELSWTRRYPFTFVIIKVVFRRCASTWIADPHGLYQTFSRFLIHLCQVRMMRDINSLQREPITPRNGNYWKPWFWPRPSHALISSGSSSSYKERRLRSQPRWKVNATIKNLNQSLA